MASTTSQSACSPSCSTSSASGRNDHHASKEGDIDLAMKQFNDVLEDFNYIMLRYKDWSDLLRGNASGEQLLLGNAASAKFANWPNKQLSIYRAAIQ